MKLHRNIYLWYATTFLCYAAFALPIWVIFSTDVLGLNNTQAFLLGVLSYGVSSLFEIPTGSWADKYGRVKVYRWGTILFILSMASYIFISNFYILALFQLVGALGIAMQSGSLEALVHESLKKQKQEKLYPQIHGRMMAFLFFSRVVTVLLSGFLYSINPRLPFAISVICYLLGFIVSLFLEEIRNQTPTKSSNLEHIKETFMLIMSKQTLVLFFILVVIHSYLSESLFALYQPYFKSLNINVGQFGFFYAIISIFSALGALSINRLAKAFNPFTILLGMMLTVLFTLSSMLLKIPLLLYLVIIPSAIVFGFTVTLQNSLTQKLVGSKNQATAVSIASFSRNFAFMMSMITVGILLDLTTVPNVNMIFTILTAISTIPFLIFAKKKVRI